MPLRLITGPANAGKTGEVLKEALVAAQRGLSPVVAVPNVADVRRLESELAGKAPLGVRVATLDQFVEELWMLFGDGRKPIASPARDAVIAGLIAEGVDSELLEAAHTPGFSRLMSRLAASCTPRSPSADSASPVGRAVEALLERYRVALHAAGVVERQWLGALLAECEPRLDGPLGVARYDCLTDSELSLLTGLAKANSVSVALTWEHMFAPTRANDNAVERLSAIAAAHIELQDPSTDDEIQALARSLYSGPAGAASRGGVVTALASGIEAEVALVARLVAYEVGAGVPAERIAVAFPRSARRTDSLERALLSYGVAAGFEVVLPLVATQMGRAWYALLSLATGRGGRAEALTYLASPYSGASAPTVHEYDRMWRTKRVGDAAGLIESMMRLDDECGRAVELARRISRRRVTPDSVAGWQELADTMISRSLTGRGGSGLDRAASQDAAAYRSISRLAGEMSLLGDLAPDASAVLKASLGAMVREGGAESEGRVQVCDFRSIGTRRFDVLVLGGLTEDEVALGDRDEVEDELSVNSVNDFDEQSADRLRLQFYSLVTRARDRLYLVRQDADSEGRERRASALWEDAMDAYRMAGASIDDPAPHAPTLVRMSRSQIEELAPAFTLGRRDARCAADHLRLRVLLRGAIATEPGLSAISREAVYSATEIETYLECPYKWFYQRILAPEEIDSVFDARELGTLAHRLLAAFYRAVGALPGRDRVTTEWLSEALELFEQVVAGERTRLRIGGLSEELDAARAVAWARNVVGQDATWLPGFVPSHVEMEFGREPSFSFAGHAFRGRIDRIEMSDSSVFVTDYKSSRDVAGLAKFEAQAKVQAVVYACAAASVSGMPVAGSVYRSVRSGRLRGFWRSDLLGGLPQGMCEDDAIDSDGFAELVAATAARVERAISGMRAGCIPREPTVAGACAYCPLAATCEGARP